MNNENRPFPVRPLSLLLAAALLTGCANYAPVRDFARETRALSNSFEPMLAGSHASCMEGYQRKKLITSRNYDAREVAKEAKALCQPVVASNQVMVAVNELLRQYADTLQAMADGKQVDYRSEAKDFGKVLQGLRHPVTDTPLMDDEQAVAISGLAEFLATAATRHMQRSGMRELLGHQEAIDSLAAALDEYALSVHLAWLADEKRDMPALERMLKHSADEHLLAANFLQRELLEQQWKVEARERSAIAFSKAVERFRSTNAQLSARFDELDSQALREEIKTLGREVAALKRVVDAAY